MALSFNLAFIFRTQVTELDDIFIESFRKEEAKWNTCLLL